MKPVTVPLRHKFFCSFVTALLNSALFFSLFFPVLVLLQMSLGASESSGEGTNIKRATSPIRHILARSSSSAPCYSSPSATKKTLLDEKPIKKLPLTGPDMNQLKKSDDTTKPTTPSKPASSLGSSTIEDLFKTAKRKSHFNNTSSSNSTTASASDSRPGLKRSHSAISSLDAANEPWLNTPITTKHQKIDKKEVVGFYS